MSAPSPRIHEHTVAPRAAAAHLGPTAGEAAAARGQAAGEAAVRVKRCGARGSPFLRPRAVLRARRAGDPELGCGSRCARRV
ncbi:hypothetical protein NDU88_007018 [Pleurodeles waltl]|uniref:Uncharacterized protein n=1 Tax=Pleurodeles waltl TaxID=8319 RepID=A0AAV7QJL5_PLEWA|nr:hypothetical protein NDU88_007018 [Pleurodeles waltl]